MMNRKCYSTDEEYYNFCTFSEVVDSLLIDGDNEVGRSYWEADAIPVTHEYVIKNGLQCILEQLDETCRDDIGDTYDYEYTSTSKEAKDELQSLLVAWGKKHVDISKYYFVKNSVEKQLTAEDITEHIGD